MLHSNKEEKVYEDFLFHKPDSRRLPYFFGFFINILKINPPISPPYSVLFTGLEVMGQLPVKHPIST